MSLRLRIQPRRPGPARRRGAVLIELALVLPLLIMLAIATFELAQAVASYKVLTTQVRAAARYLSTMAPGTGAAEAACIVKHGDPACSGPLLLPGVDSNFAVQVADSANAAFVSTHRAQNTSSGGTAATAVNLVTVTASGYNHPLMVGGFLSAFTGSTTSVTFNPIRVTMRQIS